MINFNLYNDLHSVRKRWANLQRNANIHANAIFNEFVEVVVRDAKRLTPKRTGTLRSSVKANVRGFLKVSFVAHAIDEKTGEDYAIVRHEVPAKHYWTKGTRDHYLYIPFREHSIMLASRLVATFSPSRDSAWLKKQEFKSAKLIHGIAMGRIDTHGASVGGSRQTARQPYRTKGVSYRTLGRAGKARWKKKYG